MHSQPKQPQQLYPALHSPVLQKAKNTMVTNLRNFSLFFVGIVLLSIAGVASAAWEVVDNDLNKKLEQIRNNQTVKSGDGSESSGKEVEEPKEMIKKIPDDLGLSACAASTRGTPVSDSQRETCQLIQRTLNSQYNYVVAMYEITAKRLERLRAIEQERKKIDGQKIGELESNTNKLLALRAMMDIDRQQMESAMFAYDKRITYLNGQQNAAAKAAMAGKEPPKSNSSSSVPYWVPDNLLNLGKTIAAGAAMKFAFDSIKSKEPDGYKPLMIDKN